MTSASYGRNLPLFFSFLFVVTLVFTPSLLYAQPLRACATVPELGSLLNEVGGDRVTVTTFAKGTEDAHFVEAKPSFIKALSLCDVYAQIGMELEIGWAPVLLREARNGKVLPGAPGYIDAATAITPLDVPTAAIDRSMGDVHPFGNPHFLLDPLNGLKVANLLRERLSGIQPASAAYFAERYAAFRRRLGVAMVGETLAAKYEFEKLALLFARSHLGDFLTSQGDAGHLSGWFALMNPYRGVQVVMDHNVWSYFTERYGLQIAGSLEPKPGIPPTTAHLSAIIQRMKANQIPVVLTTAYYEPRYARLVSENTGAKIAAMAHQVGAQPGTEDYVSMSDYNVRQLARVLKNESIH